MRLSRGRMYSTSIPPDRAAVSPSMRIQIISYSTRVLMSVILISGTVSLTGCRKLFGIVGGAFARFDVRTYDRPVLSGGQTLSAVPRPSTIICGHHFDDWGTAYGWVRVYGGWYTGYSCFDFLRTDRGGERTIWFGRTPAFWDALAYCDGPPNDVSSYSFYQRIGVNYWGSILHFCRVLVRLLPFSSSRFEISNTVPSTLTVGGANLSVAYGMPMLHVYNRAGEIVHSISAISVSSDGSTATFPFPTHSNGSPLSGDMYGLAITNWDSPPQTVCQPMYDDWGNYIGDHCWEEPGVERHAGTNYLAIATPVSIANAPFGVEAFWSDVNGNECYTYYDPCFDGYCDPIGQTYCTSWTYTHRAPIVTLNSSGQVYRDGYTLPVGSSPTAIKLYGLSTQVSAWGDGSSYSYYEERTQPSRALVLNGGSNSVSVLDLDNWQVMATIPTGSRPTGLAIKADETRAYVANYDSATVTEINLSTNSVARTASVGYRPTAVAMDPSGSAVWVGGQGWMSKIDVGSFSVVATYTINGTINSLAASAGQGSLVYTALTNSSAPNSTYGEAISYPGSIYSVRQVRLSDMSTTTDLGVSYGDAYVVHSGSTPAIPSLLANGTGVSVKYNNGLSISLTPDGFVALDVTGGTEIMRGRTPTPPRSVAADPNESVLYITLPESNLILIIPIPIG
jgi:YVTN family beta-propeller protein